MNTKNPLLLAALGGLLMGATACAGSSTATQGSGAAASQPADGEKHSCEGKDGCPGKEGGSEEAAPEGGGEEAAPEGGGEG